MLQGIFLGIVEKVNDPDKLGRVKVRVHTIYGDIPVDDLPWAIPLGLPAGGSSYAGGFSMLPDIGDQVAVQFLDEEPEKPVWQPLMQTLTQAQRLKLHHYNENNQAVGFPDRAILTRYGHSLEFKPTKVTLTTSEGQQVLLQTSAGETGGRAGFQTPKGQSLILNDMTETTVLQALSAAVISASKVNLNAPTSALVKTQRFTLMAGTSMIIVQGNTVMVTTGSGASLVIDESGNVALSSAQGASVSVENDKVQVGEPTGTGIVLEGGKMSVNAPQAVFNSSAFSVGTGQGWPVIIMSPQALAWFMGHTHTNGNNGSPTGPPIMPFPQDAQSTRMQTS